MKIQSLSLSENLDDRQRQQQPERRAEVVMVRISGPINQSDPVLRRARQLVERSGSRDAVASFDAAIASEALIAQE